MVADGSSDISFVVSSLVVSFVMAKDAEEEPPFPWMAMSALCVGMLGHSVAFTSPLPYVAFMVVDFGMVDNLDQAGYFAGWITGAFMIGRTIASVPWGIAADKWGRKPCLLLSMFNVAVLGLWFGFSTNFTMAIILRFLIGLGNGFMCVAKTCISEIVQTKEHELKGFGYLNSIWGLGLIVGPVLGGLLSRVAVQYPGSVSDDSIWAKYPYLLPSVICSLIAVIAGVWVFISLEETLGKNNKLITNEEWKKRRQEAVSESTNEDSEIEMTLVGNPMTESSGKTENRKWNIIGSMKREKIGFQALPSEEDGDIEEGGSKILDSITEEEPTDDSQSLIADNNRTIDNSDSNEVGDEELQTVNLMHTTASCGSLKDSNEKSAGSEISPSSTTNVTAKPKTMLEILYDWDCRILFTIYLSFRFLVMFIDECFPLWAVTSLEKGGLDWDSRQVGEVLAFVGAALIVFQMFIFQPMMKAYFPHGPADTYSKFCYLCAIAASSVPFAASLGLKVMHTKTPEQSRENYVLFVGVLLCMMIFRISLGSAFTTLSVVVNNSVDQSMRGTMNGLIMTAGSVGNTFGPIVGSICYAVSLSIPQFLGAVPIDGRMMFVTGGLMSVGVGLFARKYLVVS